VTTLSRPLPWHDTPKCRDASCDGPVIFDALIGLAPRCTACGAAFEATPEERARIHRAEAAWDRVLAGEVHEDMACSRCGGCLPIEQFRLCPECVAADTAGRQGRLL
jgi:hypothetical protein